LVSGCRYGGLFFLYYIGQWVAASTGERFSFGFFAGRPADEKKPQPSRAHDEREGVSFTKHQNDGRITAKEQEKYKRQAGNGLLPFAVP